MPLTMGSSDRTIGRNISEMRAAGHSEKQSVAAAEREADEAYESRGKKKYADMDMGKSKKKAVPTLAIALGKSEPMDDEDMSDVDDEGADDEESALQQAGDAAIEALHAKDGLSFMKALLAGMRASKGEDEDESGDTEAADLDMMHDGGSPGPMLSTLRRGS